jgi:hypothetical protein
MLRFGIGTMLAVLLMALVSESASAQSYPCPNGAGPGERQVGTAGGGNSGLAPFPVCESADESQPSGRSVLQFYWVDNFVAVAWHLKASDVWAVSRARSAEEGEKGALALCEVAMKDGGCTIANVVAMGRSPSPALRTVRYGRHGEKLLERQKRRFLHRALRKARDASTKRHSPENPGNSCLGLRPPSDWWNMYLHQVRRSKSGTAHCLGSKARTHAGVPRFG